VDWKVFNFVHNENSIQLDRNAKHIVAPQRITLGRCHQLDCTALNGMMADGLEKICKVAVVTWLISRHFLGGVEDNHDDCQTIYKM
jgi:hypothetical protein